MYKTNKFKEVQSTIDAYIKTPITHEAKYRRLKDGGGGCTSIQECVTSTYAGYFKKMLRPTNMHYAYVRAVLTTVFIEPIYMPLGGPHIWKIAARTFYETHLPFWGDLCEFF